jgi:type VI protein secretion system component Hcp
VEIEAYAAGGKEGLRLVDEFKFDDALVTSQQAGGAFDSPAAHNVSFNFSKLGHTHVEYTENGGVGSETGMTFDVQANTASSTGPAANSDAIKGEQEAVVGADLELYLRVDGVGAANEWLKLGSYSVGYSVSGGIGGGGGGAGTAILQDLSAVLGSSSELVELTEMLAKGQHIKSVELEAYALGGKEGHRIIDEFKFTDVLVSSWQTSDATVNSLTFDYAGVSYGHQLYSETGAPSGFAGDHDPVGDIAFF